MIPDVKGERNIMNNTTIANIASIKTVESAKEFARMADDFAYLCKICKKLFEIEEPNRERMQECILSFSDDFNCDTIGMEPYGRQLDISWCLDLLGIFLG